MHNFSDDRLLHSFPHPYSGDCSPFPPQPSLSLHNHLDASAPPLVSPMDPNDYRAFYAYIPNEVKHRKRTSSAQLKVLEGIFKTDTKPNAALRKELAQRLDMSTRGVQVWFQNRRAKEKTKAAKAAASTSGASAANDASTVAPESPVQRELQDIRRSETSSILPPLKRDPITPPLELSGSANSSWQNSPVDQLAPLQRQSPRHLDPFAGRRGSLPINALMPSTEHTSASYGPPLLDHVDLPSRRFSVDTSLSRLGINPYANVARSRNAGMTVPPISAVYQRQRPYPYYSGRPNMMHRASMPAAADRRFSMDSRPFGFPDDSSSTSPSPSPLSPFHPSGSLPDNNLYAVSSRHVPMPLPGPLPSPDFQFGAPSSTPPPHPADDPVDPLCTSGVHGYDPDDEAARASYDHFSRFGSITSVATSETGTSACYSDVGSFPEYDVSRRSSESSGFLDMMTELNVNSAPGLDESRHQQNEQDDGSTKFPTPSPTVSPSGSPHSHDGSPSTNYQMATSSELAYALTNEQQSVASDRSGDGSSSSEGSPPGMPYRQSGYPLSAPGSGSTLELELGNKVYPFEPLDEGPYHGQVSYPSLEAHTFSGGPEIAFGIGESPFMNGEYPEEQSMVSLLGMKFTPPYGGGATGAVRPPSSVASSVESLPSFT